MTKPLLSICIPTYNRADILEKTLAHLRQVCSDEVEIVVSDNCSADRTPAVIAEFAATFRRIRSVRQPENRGSQPNFAAAISLATGEYLYTLGDDDEIFFDGLMSAIAVMKSAPEIVAVYGAYHEWVRETGDLSPPIRVVEQRLDFARGEKVAVLNRFSLLWFPVCRTQILQRFFTYDDKSFGFWELVGLLLEHGSISILPDIFYKHAHTQPRMEYELTKGWYHDAHRAQFEQFLGRIGPSDFQMTSTFVNSRVVPAYLQGVRFAKLKGEVLTARHFLLRARVYGQVTEAEIAEWERESLAGMVAERLLRHVDLVTGMAEVLFEEDPRLFNLREHFRSIAPSYSVGAISQREWAAQGLRANCYLVIREYGAIGWQAAAELGPARCRAATDMIESCRITDQPLSL